ncbi:hypothetical protein CG724_34870 [Streptomyces sp. CB02120-2]|nr:hypothetical protein [Streptomyces sp. KCTC 0041BP]PJN14260.1 hypothetical protein CG724_34870 [Streptomyces sp. CB02120-2]
MRLRGMTRERTGRIIGASFGLAFIQVNAGALPVAAGTALRVLAVAAFVALLITLRRAPASGPAPRPEAAAEAAPAVHFGRRYRYVVAAEAVVGVAGIVVINNVLHTPRATVGWIALVVGVHFFGLAVVWRMPALHLLGAGLSGCGAAGLALAAAGAPQAAVAAVAGVLPGALLLGSAWWKVRGDAEPRRAATPSSGAAVS